MTTLSIAFPGGVAVDAILGEHVVHTDQPRPVGADTAVSPFDLFLASMATCMGFYALRFCQERSIPTEGMGLTLEAIRDAERTRVATLRVALTVPPAFPENYLTAVRRAIDTCAVKRAVLEPPEFDIAVVRSGT